jgi:amino acid adenylation domain-containing protein
MSVDRPEESQARLTPVDFDPFADERDHVLLPLTAPQQEVWTAAQMSAAASAAYNQCFPLRLTGRLSMDSLRAAVGQLVDRHEALRATFSPGGDEQAVSRAGGIPIAEVDLSSQPADARARAIAELLARESRDAFDLTRGPLARIHVVREAADRHLLVLTAHHLVCDGWSSGLMFRDLSALYTADRYGLTAQLPEVMSYSQYVRQAAGCSDEEIASADYWVSRFAGEIPVLELPTDSGRSPVRSFRGSHERLTFDADLYRDVKALGARHGCTLYVTLLAAWQALLMRLAGQQDLVVGIPVSAQSTLANGNLVGHCVHMLPLRLRVDPSATFAQHLVASRTALVEGHEHRAITCGRLIQLLNLHRDAGHAPLAAAVFNVDKLSDLPAFEGLAAERLVPPRSGYNFDIGLDIADTGIELQIECNYDIDLFDAATVRRWLDYYRNLLTSAIADASTSLARLTMLPAAETAALRTAGQGTVAYEERSLHEAFEAVAAETPDVVAVSMGEESATYDELNRRANQLGRHLQALGVKRGTLVGVCLDRSIDLVAAILGVLKAGAAYVPLDPDCPTDRIRTMIDDARPAVVVASEKTVAHFAESSATAVVLERDRAAIQARGHANVPGQTSPDDLAYVIFTSGSTGRPKGVAVSHGNVSRLFSATDRWFHFGPDDVWTLFHSFAFDFSVWEIWGALLYGGRLVVVPHTVSRSPEAFHELLRHERVTVLNQTPSAFRQLIEADRGAAARLQDLRYVIFGGEALDLTALRPWVDRYGDAQPALVNMYGITETTVHVTYRRILEADVRAGSRSPIGAQIPDLQLYLLAPDTLELVPVGVAGEICVGGAGVAPGYLNRPELTDARFVPNPFGAGRLYRSGDLARRRADGDIDYLGRIDQQVKIRGFRIELGEIESVLLEHPAVSQAAVVVTSNGTGEPRLAAYLVTQSNLGVPADLLTHLRTRLPDYMVPAAFVFLDKLPINENGKLDRRRLPAPGSVSAVSHDPVPPRTPTEEALAAIWQEALELSFVGVHDSFFDLGGHSILAVKIARRSREAFGIDLPVAALFHAPTVAKLAEAIDALKLTARPRAASTDREVIEL